jgi:diacylglycerol kinase (ATP)
MTPRRRIAVIMNPAARSTKAASMVDAVRSLPSRIAPEIHFTTEVGHASALAEQLAGEGAEVVVAVGGDGTVNEVLQGICRVNATRPDPATHCILGTLPAGTMNVFSYELGYHSHTDIVTPWDFIQAGAVAEIDLWMANDQYFLQLAGVGVDAEIVKLTSWEQKRRLGPLSYVMSALRVLRKSLPVITLEAPGRAPMHGSMALIGNGVHYGGPFSVFPQASNTDGKLDVLLMRERELNAWHGWQLIRGVYERGYTDSEDLDYLQLDEFTITCKEGTSVELDGEVSGATPVAFRKAPFRLRVAAPCSQASARQIAVLRAGLAASSTGNAL